jgi:hypothetical protein
MAKDVRLGGKGQIRLAVSNACLNPRQPLLVNQMASETIGNVDVAATRNQYANV